MIKRLIGLVTIVTSAVALFAVPAHATQTTPYMFTYQGRLTDSVKNVLPNGQYNVKFRIMNAFTGGTNLWEADRVYGGVGSDYRITLTNGQFSIKLGDTSQGDPALSPSLFTTQPLYMEVELPTPATARCSSGAGCASFTEGAFADRQVIAASPYVMNADTIDGIDGSALAQMSANQTFSGNNTFTGTTLFKPASDSTTAFQIQSSSAAPLLVADTQNLDLKIGGGDVSPNGTPALLVVDYKNTSGDPSGVNGSIYYNTTADKFRCMEAGAWRDCINDSRTLYEYHNDLLAGKITSGTAVDSGLVPVVSNSAVISRRPGEANHPGILRFDLGTTFFANGWAGLGTDFDSGNTDNSLKFGAGTWITTVEARLNTLATSSNNYVYYAGFLDNMSAFSGPQSGCMLLHTNSTLPNQAGGNVTTGDWAGACAGGGSATYCDTGMQPVAGKWYRLKTAVNAAGTQASFAVTDIATGTTATCPSVISTNLPTNPISFGTTMVRTAGTGSGLTADIDYVETLGMGLVRN